MACFIVPGTEAIIVTAIAAAQKRKEKKAAEAHVSVPNAVELPEEESPRISLARKLSWLKYMLWGGVILLAFEHIWHGEIVPYPPFLTALRSPGDTAVMLKEMATVGVAMAALITVAWAVLCVVADSIVRRSASGAADEAAR